MYTFTLGWINYLSHSILQLKGEYLIAGKQMALPFWVCLTRTKKLIGLQPYSHRLRSCQIPSGREIWIWWLVSNRIFQGQKRKQLVCRLFVCFKITSAYHRRKIKKNLTLPLPLIVIDPNLRYLYHFNFSSFNQKKNHNKNELLLLINTTLATLETSSLLMRNWAILALER